MNCERCQELIGDLIDGTLSGADQSTLKSHLDECLDCVSVREDLTSILSYCRAHRGEYEAPPNEKALWLRIVNVVEAELVSVRPVVNETPRRSWWSRSWELSFPQLASLTVGIVLLVSLVTTVGIRRWQTATPVVAERLLSDGANATVNDRIWQRQQVINYWNQRVEVNKARWSADMRETFERNMRVIDQAVSNSMNELNQNPHDDISEQMLNEALNDKLALLKEFSDL